MATDVISDPASAVPRRSTDALFTRLADAVGARMTASTVFGEAVTREGVTVIPVASMRFGFGGGGGSEAGSGQEGLGGGAMGRGSAVGYIEIKDGRTRFVPVVHPAQMAALMCGAVLAGMLVIRRRRG